MRSANSPETMQSFPQPSVISPPAEHIGSVHAIAFSPEGSLLASGGYDRTVKLRRVGDGEIISSLGPLRSAIVSLAFSPNGAALAVGTESGLVRLFDLRGGELSAELSGHRGRVMSLHFSADGGRLASAGDNRVILWDLNTRKPARTLDHRDRYKVTAVAVSSDGRFVLTAASGEEAGEVILWNAGSGEQQHILARHKVFLARSVALWPDDNTAACGTADGEVFLWDVGSGAIMRQFAVSAARTARARLDEIEAHWDDENPSEDELRSLLRQQGAETVRSIAFGPDGNSVAVGMSGKVNLWEADTGCVRWSRAVQTNAVGLSPLATLMASAHDEGDVRLWHTASGEELKFESVTRDTIEGSIDELALSPDGRSIAIACSWRPARNLQTSALWLWQMESATLVQALMAMPSGELAKAISEDSMLVATVNGEGLISLRETASGRLRQAPLRPHKEAAHPLAQHTFLGPFITGDFSRDGRLFAMNDGVSVLLLDASSGELLNTLTGHTRMVSCIAFAPDNATLASGDSCRDLDEVIVWDMSSATVRWREWVNAVYTLAFSPDARWLALATHEGSGDVINGFEVHVLETASGEVVQCLKGHNDCVSGLSFSPDGATLATVGSSRDVSVKLWDTSTWELRRTLEGHDPIVFAPDGQMLVTGGGELTLRFWSVASGRLCASMMLLPQEQNDGTVALEWIVFTPAGYYDCSPTALNLVQWRAGIAPFPIERHVATLHRQDLVRQALHGAELPVPTFLE